MKERERYLIVDGHSVIFSWPELRKLHDRRTALGREALTRKLRDYQDWSGVRVVVVFDGKGPSVNTISEAHEVQIFYSREGQAADAIIERLTAKYAERFDVAVATSDLLEQQTVSSFGATCISPEILREVLDEAIPNKIPVRK
jgi:predicted RNA-binding protein with PIN domain